MPVAKIMESPKTAVASQMRVDQLKWALQDQREILHEQAEIISLLLNEFDGKPSDWLWRFDSKGHLYKVSDRFAAVCRDGNLTGKDFCTLLRSLSMENEAIALSVARDVQARTPFHDVIVKVDRDTEENWWCLSGKPLLNEGGVYQGYVGTASDITAERLVEREVSFLAHHDALTGLLNRAQFTDRLKQAVAKLERYGSPFAILYMDLDKFKFVNDSRGHLIGDRLLTEVGKRIRATLSDADTAARLGGDEFAIILNNDCDVGYASALASRLIDKISEAYHLDEEIISIGVSIGIALAPINGTRPDQILRNADLALYRAKAEGRGAYRLFEAQMDSSMRERRMLELELRQAIKNGEFVLHYQPLVSADDNRPTGFEALMRWDHPIRGVVPPIEFIPIAEFSGLIQQIGDWAIQEACAAAACWPGDMVVAVNISPKHFQLSDIISVVRKALADSKLPPQRLELEITESLLIQRPEEVVAKLSELKALGITITMDDFGTGYSSLSYLMKFPFDKIKIDRSFVKACTEDNAARDILRTIAALGKSLKMRVTAEGVETFEQVEFLREIACNQLQGYFFAKPLNEIGLAGYLINQFQAEHRKSRGNPLNANSMSVAV